MSLENVYRYIKSEACRSVGSSAVIATNKSPRGTASPLLPDGKKGRGGDEQPLSSRIVRENVLGRNR